MSIKIEQVTKLYQNVPVVNDVTVEIHSGEFFVLLGPSGSGKSTLLRALAGLTLINHGRMSLHGRDVTTLPARHRGVGLVFQHYALFRHMTVADNIEFALRVRRMRAAERRRRRQELLQLVALEGFDERYPSQLSGGQQQRVAVARALAHEPAVLLMDEPFGALDAKTRVELRDTVRAVQRRIGMSTILVTHDQEEAFALADRIGVMQMGRLLETGTPEALYRQPTTRFVARFLGAANLFLGEVSPRGLHLGAATVLSVDANLPSPSGAEAVLVVRPEDIEIATHRDGLLSRPFAEGSIRGLSFAGHQIHVSVQLDAGTEVKTATAEASETQAPPDSRVGPEPRLVVVDSLRSVAEQLSVPLSAGMRVSLGVRRVHALPTPISSFQLLPTVASTVTGLVSSPLLAQLVRSMQARVIYQPEKLDAGICVLPLDAHTPAAINAAVIGGARRLLCIPALAPLPGQILIHTDDGTERSELVTLVSSVMRHLPIAATGITLQHSAATRSEVSEAQRLWLDTRADLRRSHGLDLRGEQYIGSLYDWLTEIVARQEPVLVVLTLPSAQPALAVRLEGDLAVLFNAQSQAAVLLAVALDS